MTGETLLVALIAALAVWCLWQALTHPFTVSTGAELSRREQYISPMIDRAFGPLLGGASQLLRRVIRREDEDAQRLLTAGQPAQYPTVASFYAWKVFAAVALFLVGVGNAIFFFGAGFLPAAFALGALGLYLPDLQLNGLIKQRRMLIRTEMAFTLNRLAVYVSAGQTLAVAIMEIAQKPGSLFIEQLRFTADDMKVGKSLDESFEGLRARNPGVDDIDRFVETAKRALRIGQPLAATLTSMGDVLQDKVMNETESRGHEKSAQMILPIGALILPAIMIAVLGPAAYVAMKYFFH